MGRRRGKKEAGEDREAAQRGARIRGGPGAVTGVRAPPRVESRPVRDPGELFRRAVSVETARLGRFARYVVHMLHLLLLAPREFFRDHGLQWASSLAFSTLLALVPLGILAFSLVDVFEKFLSLDQPVEDLLVAQGLPDAADKAGEEIRRLIERAQTSSGKMGIIGFGLLVLVGHQLFGALERAVNQLWKVPERRNAFRRFLAFWVVLTLGPVLFGVSLWATAKLRSPALVESAAAAGWLVRAVVWVLPLMITCSAFYVFFVFLPNTRVRPKSAFVAALIAGGAWEAAKWGFNLYVANAAQIDRVYGPLGILPVFLLWIYITWVITLLGVEFAYVDQNYAAVVAGVAGTDAERGTVREYQGLRLLCEVYRPFRAGKPPPDLHALGRLLRLRTETVRDLLRDLTRAKLLRRDSGGFYLPAREAGRIHLGEVVAAVRGRAGDLDRLGRDGEEGEQQRESRLSETTLADLLGEAPAGASTDGAPPPAEEEASADVSLESDDAAL